MGSNLRIFHAEQNLLVVVLGCIIMQMGFLVEDNLLGGMLCHDATDDTGEQNHHDDSIQHIVVHQILVWCYLQSHTNHQHSDGASSMGRGETEHHVTIGL